MTEQLISTAVQHTQGLPDKYVRAEAEAERSRLDEVVPVVDLANPDSAAVVTPTGFFQALNRGLPLEAMRAVAHEFVRLSPEDKANLYSDDPTSFNYLRLHCHPLQQLVPEWGVISEYLKQVRELAFRLYAAIRENPQTNAPIITLTDQLQIIKNEDLQELRVLGSGAFGTVYHGTWLGTDVAIKRFKKNCFSGQSYEQAQKEFWREAEILSKLHHPNVVAFYGVVKDGPGGTLATLTEFMVNGSLRHVLQRNDKCLDLGKRLIIAMDAAFGMEYLHSKNIVHFDLKSDNLLVDLRDHARPICKVGDFGLSKIKKNTLISGGLWGTLPWMAPELLNGATNKVSEKVDVFSFGIVMWELLTGEEPYSNMHCGAIVGGIASNTLRPTVPDNCWPEWRRLMEQCWSQDPARRPAFSEIAARLQSMSSAAAI